MQQYEDLHKILEEFSHIRMATEADNEAILKFYKNESMQTKEESISFARDPNFFDLYRLTTDTYWTFLFLNDDLSIGGMGSVLRHMRQLENESTPLAYFCDLRISHNAGRKARVQWRQFFPRLVSALPRLEPSLACKSAYTAILANNDAAINSLTKSGRGITYRHLGTYYVKSHINTGLFPNDKFYTKEISTEEFQSFYNKQNGTKFLSEDTKYTHETLTKKHATFNNLGVFSQGNLIAIARPVTKNITRRLKVQNLKGTKLQATKLLKLLGRPTPGSDGELSTLELTYLTFAKALEKDDRDMVIESIWKWIKRSGLLREIHIINYVQETKEEDVSMLRQGIAFTTNGHLFEIHPEEEKGILPKSSFRFEGAFL
ncbi:hypothetical protein [Bacteriovorax sp. Seq25_V]|uniref:hypothetical protein n=1 Tax=Bacteriovorax sp. Seq25_V TaxID=1201288 RepID=UPI000389F784|nr:hypothetical protein [Bacteriovorax sp. Seq25_V]EQC47756.1 hypothetical protein M900_A0190 [Bacteriovorax sp. Seq25_V]